MILAVVMALMAGVTLVVGRSLNSRLSGETGVFASTMYNYIFGLAGAVLVFFVLGRGANTAALKGLPWWVYTGGLLGVVVVTLLNVAVSKISSFYFTLLTFVGQMAVAAILDVILTGEFSLGNILGSLVVAVGFCINLWMEHREMQKTSTAAKEK